MLLCFSDGVPRREEDKSKTERSERPRRQKAVTLVAKPLYLHIQETSAPEFRVEPCLFFIACIHITEVFRQSCTWMVVVLLFETVVQVLVPYFSDAVTLLCFKCFPFSSSETIHR